MTNRNKAFSLIELIVVISIIAILTTIAIPAYKRYKFNANVAAITPLLDSYVQKALVYANVHGQFPSAQNLVYGVTTPSTYDYAVTPPASLVEKGIDYIWAGDKSVAFGYGSGKPCGAIGNVSFVLDGVALGLATPYSTVVINCILVHKDNQVDAKCMYNYSTSTENVSGYYGLIPYIIGAYADPGDIIPGMTNFGTNYSAMGAFTTGAICM